MYLPPRPPSPPAEESKGDRESSRCSSGDFSLHPALPDNCREMTADCAVPELHFGGRGHRELMFKGSEFIHIWLSELAEQREKEREFSGGV